MIPSRIQTDWIPNDSETDFAFTRNHFHFEWVGNSHQENLVNILVIELSTSGIEFEKIIESFQLELAWFFCHTPCRPEIQNLISGCVMRPMADPNKLHPNDRRSNPTFREARTYCTLRARSAKSILWPKSTKVNLISFYVWRLPASYQNDDGYTRSWLRW